LDASAHRQENHSMSLEDLTPAQIQQLRLGQLLLETNPEIALDAKKLARRANPNLRLPEVDLEEKLEKERAERRQLEDKIERQRIEDRVAAREREIKKQIESSGFSVEEIEKIVKDEDLHGAAGINTALKLAELQRQAAAPGAAEMSYPGTHDMRGDPNLRKLSAGDLRRWSLTEGHKMVDDFLKRQRSGR
jgi:hypothetical protein